MISFRVYGTPAPQGSKRHVGNGVMVESSKKVEPWREAVKFAALRAKETPTPFGYGQPVTVVATFFLPRPKSHYRTGKNARLIRDSAPQYPATKPDLDKLIRSTLDALGFAGVYVDDAQVRRVNASKHYATDAEPVGARIQIQGDDE